MGFYQQPGADGGDGVHRRQYYERRAVVDAGAGGRLLSNAGSATGVAWMLGIGRFGGILGAFSGAFLMQAQLSFETIFTLLAILAFLSAIALPD